MVQYCYLVTELIIGAFDTVTYWIGFSSKYKKTLFIISFIKKIPNIIFMLRILFTKG